MLRFSYCLLDNAQRHCISNASSLASHLLPFHSLSPHDFDSPKRLGFLLTLGLCGYSDQFPTPLPQPKPLCPSFLSQLMHYFFCEQFPDPIPKD